MKNLLLLICCLIAVASFAQGNIEGVGKFKIGKTKVAIIDELVKESGSPRQVVYDVSELQADSFQVAELVINKENPLDFHLHSTHCPQGRMFLINRYSIAGVDLTNIVLTFKGGTLISFYCDNSLALDDALVLKYGKTTTTGRKEQSPCAGKVNDIFSKRWINGPILATEYTKFYYDTSCRKHTIDYFWVRNTVLMGELKDCSAMAEAKLNRMKQDDLKRKLSDFD